jgi:hypothetical protein
LPDRLLFEMGPTVPAAASILMPSPVFDVMKFWLAETRLPFASTWTPVPLAVIVFCVRVAVPLLATVPLISTPVAKP